MQTEKKEAKAEEKTSQEKLGQKLLDMHKQKPFKKLKLHEVHDAVCAAQEITQK